MPNQPDVYSHYRELAGVYRSRANRVAETAYRDLVHRWMKGQNRILEIGAGCSDLLESLNALYAVASDSSPEMLAARPDSDVQRVVASADTLPFPDASFDACFSINVLEHVSDVDAVVKETTRVLADAGLWLAVTPNGDWRILLDLAERLRMKLPEGPHRFLTRRELHSAVRTHLTILDAATFLVLPAGSYGLARWTDRLSLARQMGAGFFQYIVASKTETLMKAALGDGQPT
jgi:ubiquinone/menaquinone biosynthesis C-methylase UbiE